MHSDASPVAELLRVSKRFSSVVALDQVDMALAPGQLTALLGPNGAGKTTAVRLMLGTCRPTAGEARLFGASPPDRAARQRVGAMLQVGRVPETLTPREHLALFRSYYPQPRAMDGLLATAGIADIADRRFGTLSVGQRQRVLFAAALCGNPHPLFLDEPTVGLDIEARHLFWDLRVYALESKTELLKVARLPAYALPTIGFPAAFYVLFAVALGGQQNEAKVGTYLLATYGAFGVIGASLVGFGVGVAVERAQGWLLLKRSMPAPLGAWIVGNTVVSLVFSLAVVVVLAALGLWLGHVRMPLDRWIPLVIVLVAGAIPFSAFGLALGYLCGPNSAPAVVNLNYLPMAFLSGLWVPIEMLPGFMKNLAVGLPAYHFGQLALQAVGAGRGGPPWSHAVFLAGFTMFSIALALFAYRRDEGATFG